MSDDVKAAAARLLGAAREVITDEQHGDEYADGIGYPGLQADLVTVAQFALEAADRQAALAAELGRVKDALLEFIHAYANTDRLDHDGTEVKLFTAWIRGCAALGIKAEGHAALDTAPAEAGERL